MKITLQNVTKKFPSRNKKVREDVIAVNNFDFEIPDGKLIGLLGPSGCGKSTALNLLCGLLNPTEGRIFFGDDDVTNLPAENRGVGMVFQNYALYPHLTVKKNIMFPLENLKGSEKMAKEAMEAKALEAARLVQIDGLMERKPSELSGGQQQRVAIARAQTARRRHSAAVPDGYPPPCRWPETPGGRALPSAEHPGFQTAPWYPPCRNFSTR